MTRTPPYTFFEKIVWFLAEIVYYKSSLFKKGLSMLLSKIHLSNKLIKRLGAFVLAAGVLSSSFPSYSTSIKEEAILENQAITVESNNRENWPTGPVVSAASAILIEAETGTILYEKNIHSQEYPASTTKILTTLIAAETCSLDEMVTFSYKATHDIEPGSNHIGMDAGEQLPMEDCLKAILIRSANEVSFAVAEHIAGESWENFAPIMNERAKELGCLNSNFVNPNGLPNEEHVTTAYDLAMIGRGFFANELLCKMTLTKQLHLYPTDVQPDEIWENNQMLLIPGKEYAYEYLVGCKTGYTNAARSTLVSCAEKDGMKLICVVLRDEHPYQYEDTIALFEYGFNNFTKQNIAENETRYTIGNEAPFSSDQDIFGSSKPILYLNTTDYVVLPKNAAFGDMQTSISYTSSSPTEAATITYTYSGIPVGTAAIQVTEDVMMDYTFDSVDADGNVAGDKSTPSEEEETPSFFFFNVKGILITLGCLAGVGIIFFLVRIFLQNYQINLPKRSRRSVSRKKRRRKLYGDDLSYDLKKQRKQQIREAKQRQKRARRR